MPPCAPSSQLGVFEGFSFAEIRAVALYLMLIDPGMWPSHQPQLPASFPRNLATHGAWSADHVLLAPGMLNEREET